MRAAILLAAAAAACDPSLPDSIACRWAGAVARAPTNATCGSGLCRVAVVYYRPPALSSGDVGLEQAVKLWAAGTRRRLSLLNVHDLEGATPAFFGELCEFLRPRFDHVVVKSNWDYVVDTFFRDHLWARDGSACALTRSLQVAGSYPPPGTAPRFYDVLYYESPWYLGAFLSRGRHRRPVHAFGVDADAVADLCAAARAKTAAEERYDFLFVGAFADHAGFEPGRKLVNPTSMREHSTASTQFLVLSVENSTRAHDSSKNQPYRRRRDRARRLFPTQASSGPRRWRPSRAGAWPSGRSVATTAPCPTPRRASSTC